jgi:hypothetical protein
MAGSSDLQDSQRLCVHLMDLAVERLEAAGEAAGPGGPPPPQTVLGIFDLRGFTSANADWGFVRFLVDIFFLYYPKVGGSRQQTAAGGRWEQAAAGGRQQQAAAGGGKRQQGAGLGYG